MRIFRKIIRYLASIILSLLVLISFYTLIATGLFKQPYVNIFGHTYFVIASGSMAPTIEVNDIIIVKLDAKYEKDDIVTYKSGDSFVTHRVIEIKEDTIVAKGDANNADDNNVNKKDIIGKVVTILSSAYLLKILGLIILIFVLITVINFEDIFKKYIKKEKESTSPLEYTRAIPIIKEDNDLIDEILSKTENYKISKFYVDDELVEVRLKSNEPKSPVETGLDKTVVKEILNILKLSSKKTKITTEGAIKLQYMYRLCNTIILDPKNVEKVIDNIPFEELYNYDFEEIGFSKDVNQKLYQMPIYVYLLIMSYSIVYANDEYFDALYKTLKYRIKIMPDNEFILNSYKVDKCLKYIEKIVDKCDDKKKFKLDEIVELVKLESQGKKKSK